ncbi:MAG: hypothetical protein AAFO72_14015, partial [Pseudomonadota bacterium]
NTMKCILHIGLQKCGSTSLQRWLFANREALKDHGVLYPETLGTPNHTFLTALSMGFARKHWVIEDTGARNLKEFKFWKQRVDRHFKKELGALSGRVETVVISHEDLSTLGDVSAERCMRWLREYFDDIHVIGYVRPPAELANSFLSQRAKNGIVSDPAAYLDGFGVNFTRIAARWSTHSDDARWRSLSQIGDVVGDFCSVLKLDPGAFKAIPRTNQALSKETFDLLLHLNLQFRVGDRKNFNKTMFVEELPNQRSFKISRTDAEDIQARHAAEIESFLALAPEIAAKDLEIDPERYPEEAILTSAPPPYIPELRYIIPRLNAQIWIEKSIGRMNLAEAMILKGNKMRAKQLLGAAGAHLNRAAQVDAGRVKSDVSNLRLRLRKMKARVDTMSSRGRKRP